MTAFPPSRIQAAARAMYEARMAFWGVPDCSWERVSATNKAKWTEAAEQILGKVFPDIASGEAVEKLVEAGVGIAMHPDVTEDRFRRDAAKAFTEIMCGDVSR